MFTKETQLCPLTELRRLGGRGIEDVTAGRSEEGQLCH